MSMLDRKLFEKYQKILSLESEKIELKNDNSIYYDANIIWNDKSNSWLISFKDHVTDYYFVHELGHLYVARIKYHFDGFAKQAPDEFKEVFDFSLKALFNNLLDGIVDYNLSLFDEIYPIVRTKYTSYLKNAREFQEMIFRDVGFLELMGWYVLFFIDFNFVLKEPDRKRFSEEINDRLILVRNALLTFKLDVTRDKMENLEEKLSSFKDISKETDPKKIIAYFLNVIYSLEFWSKKELFRNAKIYFQF